jgi:hypothetical protein
MIKQTCRLLMVAHSVVDCSALALNSVISHVNRVHVKLYHDILSLFKTNEIQEFSVITFSHSIISVH